MGVRRGISVLDLLGPLPAGAQALLPGDVLAFLERLAVLDHHSITSAAGFSHFGTVQADSLALPRVTGSSRPAEAPDLSRGVYFRLLFPRTARAAGQNVEPAPTRFVLDLVFDPIAFELDAFVPARFAPASGTTPAHLEPANQVRRPGDKPRKTRLYARGAFRVAVDDTGGTNVGFVDFPDPFDPDLTAGPVFDAWFEPPHFFLKELGLSVGEVIVDFSETVTAPQVTARGQGPEWQGIAVEEAAVYLPRRVPKLGIVNFGLRDLLIGHPLGLQGEAFVELGQDPADVIHPAAGPVRLFTDDPAGSGEALTVATDPVDATGRLFRVSLPSEAPARVRAQLDAPPPESIARWRMPGSGLDGERATGFFTPVFSASPGDLLQLELTRVDEVDGEAQAVTFDTRSFLFTATGAGTARSKVDLEVEGAPDVFQNVLSVSGSPAALEGLVVVGNPGGAGTRWESIFSDLIVAGDRHTLTGIDPRVHLGVHFLVLRDAENRTRRLVVHAVREGGLVIGSEAGVFDAQGEPLAARRLKAEYELSEFHKQGQVRRTTGGTTIAADASVVVPAGVFAEVTLEQEPDAPPGEEGGEVDEGEDGGGPGGRTVERVQILMDFDEPKKLTPEEDVEKAFLGWGDRRVAPRGETGARSIVGPAGGTLTADDRVVTPEVPAGETIAEAVVRWATQRVAEHKANREAADPDVAFLIIGRCDDIGTDGYNVGLARRRAAAFGNILRDAVGGDAIIVERGEQDSPDPLEADLLDVIYQTDLEILRSDAVAHKEKPGAEAVLEQVSDDRLIDRLYDVGAPESDPRANPRPSYRRVDIVAVFRAAPEADQEVPSTNENELGQDPDLGRRIIWVPGEDAPETTEPVLTEPSYPVLVQAAIAWDSPQVAELGDVVPTKAEVAVTWVHRGVKVPENPDPVPIDSCREDPAVPEFYKLKARFAHDERTGETVYNLGLDSIGDPSGLACVENDVLASTMALAPALTPLLDDVGLDEDGARLAALITLLGIGALAAKDGRFIVEGVEAELRSRGYLQLEESRLRLGVDYAVKVGWELPLITGSDVRIRYRNVGLLVALDALAEPTSLDAEDVRFVFDEASVEVQEPGEWTPSNPTLARLLRVTAARLGTGSAWFEVDMGLALDLGVITVTQATIRASLREDGFDVDLRGLEVVLDVPGAVRGRGKLSVDPSGALASAVELQIVAAGISAAASLKLVGNFFSLFVETRFSTPIPLGGSGLGVFGFNGHLVVNGSRALPAGDIVQRELAWYALAPENRYEPKPGNWAVGLGAVVGTLPDEGFTFNASGMLALEVPDLNVVFGVDAQFLEKPGPATARGEGPPADPEEAFRLLGLIAFDSDALTVAIRGLYRYRRLVQVDAPIGAHFPFSGADPYFIRIGADGFPGSPPGVGARPGHPVKVTLLPDTLDVEATAFVMVEERGIVSLGNRTGFDFPGFAVGAGLKFELDWGNDFIGVEASAELLAGVGFSPLTVGAGVFIDGEVFFLLLSAGIEGELVFRYVDDPEGGEPLSIFGRLCAKVGFWRFKKTKCGEVEIGAPLVAPTPPPPVAGVDLVDRLDRVIASAGAEPGEATTVWPDAIPVVHFAHAVDVRLAPGSAFDPGPVEGPKWVGSKDVRFSYRVTGIEIKPEGGAPLPGPLPSAWTFPSHRGLFPGEDEAPVGDERRDLHLLSDHRFRWGRNLIEGGQSVLADPVGTLERACEPTPEPTEVCVFGELAQRRGPSLARLRPRGPSEGPFPSYFELSVRETLGGTDLARAALELSEAGLELLFGRVVPIVPSLQPRPELDGATGVYQAAHVLERGRFVVTLPMEGRFEPEVVEPELLLMLCDPGPVQAELGQRCDSYEDFDADFALQTLDHGGFHYQAIHGDRTGFFFSTTVGGQRAIRYLDQGLRIDLPETATEVVATLFVPSLTGDDVQPPVSLSMEAISRTGQTVGRRTDRRNIFDRNRAMRIEDRSGRGIDRIVLSGGSDRAHLVRVCYRARVDSRLEGLLDQVGRGTVPSVRGTTVDGVEAAWLPTVLPGPTTGLSRPPCTLVRYRPRLQAEWARVRVGPSDRARVGIVRCCGVTAEARRQHEEAEDARQDFIDGWNDPPTPPRALLDAGQRYSVRIAWEAAAWTRPLDDGVPSETETVPPPNVPYQPQPLQEFFFRTASEVTPLPAQAPIDTEDETSFDPRKARRYVTVLRPDHESAPHFTRDPVRVVYGVRYLEGLMERYGRELVVRVRRTDPPPGSQLPSAPAAQGSPPTGEVAVAFPRELLLTVDLRVLEATEEEGSCLDPPEPEGSAGDLTFELEPAAEYDLLVTAPSAADAEEAEVVIARTNFRTSRYASPRELLDAFEFAEGLPSPSLPVEILVDTALPSDHATGDAAFDAALVALGLEPFPLATDPRVALLLRLGPEVELVGVLLEGPEALHREGRLALESAEILLGDGSTVSLATVRRNDAGTRLLLAPAAPTPFGDGAATMELVLRGVREGIVRGRRFLSAGSLRVAGELVP